MNTVAGFSWRTLSLRALIASVVLAALMGMVAILSGDFGELQARVLLTTLTIGVTSILGLACGEALARRTARLALGCGAARTWVVLGHHGGSSSRQLRRSAVGGPRRGAR